MVAFRQYGHSHPKIVFIHLTIKCNTKGRFADVSHNIARLDSTISLKLQESNFLLYATRFSIMR
eukprot:COSAG01_NODE_33451_length_563_cov_13.573276_1_plen_63_part_10